jgi:hypothetical protein
MADSEQLFYPQQQPPPPPPAEVGTGVVLALLAVLLLLAIILGVIGFGLAVDNKKKLNEKETLHSFQMVLACWTFEAELLDKNVTITVQYSCPSGHCNKGDVVFHLPTFGYSFNDDALDVGCSALFTIDGFIPEKVRHNVQTWKSYYLNEEVSGKEVRMQVSNAGALYIFPEDGVQFFDPRGYVFQSTDFVYFVHKHLDDTEHLVPPPHRLTNGSSAPEITSTFFFGFLEYHDSAFYDGKVLAAWPDNSEAVGGVDRDRVQIATHTATVDADSGAFAPDSPIAVAIPSATGFYALEGSADIDPTDPMNMAVAYLHVNLSAFPGAAGGDPTDLMNAGIIRVARSADGGQTWDSINLSAALPEALYTGDGPMMVYDDFGNLWLSDMFAKTGANLRFFLVGGPLLFNITRFFVSTDKGASFVFVGEFGTPESPADPLTQEANLFDYPRGCIGGDGSGGQAFFMVPWNEMVWDNGTFVIRHPVMWVPINGFNDYGTPQIHYISLALWTPDDLFTTLIESELIVAPTGEMILCGWAAGRTLAAEEGRKKRAYVHEEALGIGSVPVSSMVCFSNPKGLTDMDAFEGPFLAARVSSVQAPSYQTVRGVPFWGFGMAYDTLRNRTYVGVVDEQTPFSGNFVLYVAFSPDLGKTWSAPRLVTDQLSGGRGHLHLRHDRVTGNVLLTWSDTVGTGDPLEINVYAGVLNADFLDSWTMT